MRPDPAASGLVLRGVAPPLRWSDYAVAAFDMDSTLITIECIDEVADFAGKKAEVAAITEAAMRGEIADFGESLRRRLALLAGVGVEALQRVLDERLRLSDGAAALLAACRAHGLATVLVSGGFTFFAEPVRERLAIDVARANGLEVADGRLTGRLVAQPWGHIVDGAMKRQTLLETCERLGVAPSRAIAVGDGANDLPMLDAAGLSVAFHAKPAVRERAMVSIERGGLDRLLELFA